MAQYKIANILLETHPRSISYPTLYINATASFIEAPSMGAWELRGPGAFDFTTFFNGCSIRKWREYTVVRDVVLHLEIKGAAARVYTTYARSASVEAVRSSDPAAIFPASEEWQSREIDIPAAPEDVIVGFVIETDGPVYIRDSYYYADVAERDIRKVELALATTTFKKEDFIIGNVKILREGILESSEPIADHFHVYVIDNGRTLDAEALSGDCVRVIPNSNVGGSGGFAYGMICALDQNATHVLLMDDDVAVSPESIIRTYNLLTLVNDDHTEAILSGSMMNYTVGNEQWEDLGYMTPIGRFAPIKEKMYMSQLDSIVKNEAYNYPGEAAGCTYAAWWYCCIPTDVIRAEGMPLPVFVRCDDAEYGIRCNRKFMSMNGICIWHLSFHARYNAAVERYQTTRNTLIAQSTTGMAPHSDFMWELNNNIRLELKKFNYTNAELVLDAFEDYMKGPEYFSQKGMAEERFMAANRNAEKLIPYEELQKQLDTLGIDVNLETLTFQDVEDDWSRNPVQRVQDLASFNGHKTVLKGRPKGWAVIPAAGWMYPAGKLHGKKYLVAVDVWNRKGVVRTINRERFAQVMERYEADLKLFKQQKKALAARYAAARPRLTSVAFWRDYLDIE